MYTTSCPRGLCVASSPLLSLSHVAALLAVLAPLVALHRRLTLMAGGRVASLRGSVGERRRRGRACVCCGACVLCVEDVHPSHHRLGRASALALPHARACTCRTVARGGACSGGAALATHSHGRGTGGSIPAQRCWRATSPGSGMCSLL